MDVEENISVLFSSLVGVGIVSSDATNSLIVVLVPNTTLRVPVRCWRAVETRGVVKDEPQETSSFCFFAPFFFLTSTLLSPYVGDEMTRSRAYTLVTDDTLQSIPCGYLPFEIFLPLTIYVLHKFTCIECLG